MFVRSLKIRCISVLTKTVTVYFQLENTDAKFGEIIFRAETTRVLIEFSTKSLLQSDPENLSSCKI
jgi:hypothetical protein